MSKARTLANFVSSGNPLADGSIAASEVTGLSTVATTGAYNDLSGKPTLSTVAATGAYADLSGKPSLATVATSGSYNDLTNKPTITATANDLSGGAAGSIPYQADTGDTAMLAAGTAGQLLQSNGAAAPSWVPAPAGGSQSFTASGAITAGNLVSLVSANTVATTTGTLNSYTNTTASSSFWSSAVLNASDIAIAYDNVTSTAVVVLAAGDGSGYVYAYLLTISGTSATLAASYTVSSSYNYAGVSVTFDATARVFLFGFGRANCVTVRAATVTTSALTFGSPVDLWSSGTAWVGGGAYVANAGGCLFSWAFSTSQVRTQFLTVSGTTISVAGSPSYIITGGQDLIRSSNWLSSVYDSNTQKTVVFYKAQGGALSYCVFTVSGTTLTSGGLQSTGIAPTGNPLSVAFNSSNNTFGIVFQVYDGGYKLQSTVASLSGSTLTVQTPTTITTLTGGNNFEGAGIGYDQNTGAFVVVYSTTNAYNSFYKFGTGSTTSITFGSEVAYKTTTTSGVLYNFPFAYSANSTALLQAPNFGGWSTTIQAFTASVTTNYTNWIGIASSTVTNGQTVPVTVISGINSSQTGLTVNSSYYVNQYGVLVTSSTGSIKVGKAVSTTQLLVTNAN